MKNKIEKEATQPALHLVNAGEATAEDICKMFSAITGKPASAVDKARVQAILDRGKQEPTPKT